MVVIEEKMASCRGYRLAYEAPSLVNSNQIGIDSDSEWLWSVKWIKCYFVQTIHKIVMLLTISTDIIYSMYHAGC